MHLEPASESDYAEIIDLVNLAFRGTGHSASWNIETGIIGGQRLTDSLLREELTRSPAAHFMIHRDEADRSLLGTVWLEPNKMMFGISASLPSDLSCKIASLAARSLLHQRILQSSAARAGFA